MAAEVAAGMAAEVAAGMAAGAAGMAAKATTMAGEFMGSLRISIICDHCPSWLQKVAAGMGPTDSQEFLGPLCTVHYHSSKPLLGGPKIRPESPVSDGWHGGKGKRLPCGPGPLTWYSSVTNNQCQSLWLAFTVKCRAVRGGWLPQSACCSAPALLVAEACNTRLHERVFDTRPHSAAA